MHLNDLLCQVAFFLGGVFEQVSAHLSRFGSVRVTQLSATGTASHWDPAHHFAPGFGDPRSHSVAVHQFQLLRVAGGARVALRKVGQFVGAGAAEALDDVIGCGEGDQGPATAEQG